MLKDLEVKKMRDKAEEINGRVSRKSQTDGSVLEEVEKRIKALCHYVQIEVAETMDERSKILRSLEHVYEPIAEMKKQNREITCGGAGDASHRT